MTKEYLSGTNIKNYPDKSVLCVMNGIIQSFRGIIFPEILPIDFLLFLIRRYATAQTGAIPTQTDNHPVNIVFHG